MLKNIVEKSNRSQKYRFHQRWIFGISFIHLSGSSWVHDVPVFYLQVHPSVWRPTASSITSSISLWVTRRINKWIIPVQQHHHPTHGVCVCRSFVSVPPLDSNTLPLGNSTVQSRRLYGSQSAIQRRPRLMMPVLTDWYTHTHTQGTAAVQHAPHTHTLINRTPSGGRQTRKRVHKFFAAWEIRLWKLAKERKR